MNGYYNQPMPEKKGGNTALIVVLILMVLGLSGYIVYDKFIKVEPTPNNNENVVENKPAEETPATPDNTQETTTTQTEQPAETEKLLTEKEALNIATPLFKKMVKIVSGIEQSDMADDCEEFQIGNIIPMCPYKGLDSNNDLVKDFNSIYSSEIVFSDVFKEINDSTQITDEEDTLLEEYNYGALLYTVKDNKYYAIAECNKSGAGVSADQTLKVNKIEANKMTFKYVSKFANEKYSNDFVLVKEAGSWKIGKGTELLDGCS